VLTTSTAKRHIDATLKDVVINHLCKDVFPDRSPRTLLSGSMSWTKTSLPLTGHSRNLSRPDGNAGRRDPTTGQRSNIPCADISFNMKEWQDRAVFFHIVLLFFFVFRAGAGGWGCGVFLLVFVVWGVFFCWFLFSFVLSFLLSSFSSALFIFFILLFFLYFGLFFICLLLFPS